MNAITFLSKEHDRFRKIFAEINDSSHKDLTKRKMLSALCQDLTRHEKMEQLVWYPQLKKNVTLSNIIKHLISEEKNADKLINGFKKIKTQQEWNEKFLELKKEVTHHASEEEKKLFPKVEKILSEAQLEEIGKAMYRFKQEHDLKLAA